MGQSRGGCVAGAPMLPIGECTLRKIGCSGPRPRVRAHHFVCALVGPPGTEVVARSSTAERIRRARAIAPAAVRSNMVMRLFRMKYFVAEGSVAIKALRLVKFRRSTNGATTTSSMSP